MQESFTYFKIFKPKSWGKRPAERRCRFIQRFLSSAKNLQHFIVLEVFGPSDRIRTCGILLPNNPEKLFLVISNGF